MNAVLADKCRWMHMKQMHADEFIQNKINANGSCWMQRNEIEYRLIQMNAHESRWIQKNSDVGW